MANITSRDPFESGGSTPYGSLDDLLRGYFVRPVNFDSRGSSRPASFRTDVFETETAYRVLADIPGVRKEDINVTIVGPEVAISAEVRREQEAGQNEKALLSERPVDKYYRAFTLGHEIDDGGCAGAVPRRCPGADPAQLGRIDAQEDRHKLIGSCMTRKRPM